MSNGSFHLQDDEFWGNYERTRDDVVGRVSRDDFLGLLIDAPKRVSLNRRHTAPVIGYFVRTLRDDLRLNAERQMLLAAVRQDTNELSIGLALDTGKNPQPQQPPTGEDPGEGATLNMFETDLRQMLDIPWEPSRYRVAVLLREFVSNPVTLELGRDSGDYQDPAVAAFIDAERARVVPPPPHAVYPAPPIHLDPGSLPDYRRLVKMPSAPEQYGIILRAERVVVDRPGHKCILQGSFRLPVARRDRVDPRAEGDPIPDVGDPRAKAVIPIHLVITGSDYPGPWVISLKVPTYEPLYEHPADSNGYFTIDLFQFPEFPRNPMTYFITAFSGEIVSGPTPIALVSEQMIGA